MKDSLTGRLVGTAFATPLLMLLAFVVNQVGLRWVAAPFTWPAGAIVAFLAPRNAHIPDIGLFFLLEFVFDWILLFVLVALTKELLSRRRENG